MHALGSWCERYRSGTRQSDRSSLWIKTRSALRLYFARSAPRSLHAPLRSHALVGSPPPKIFLGKFPSRCSGEPDGAGRGSGEPDGTEPDGTCRGSGEPDGAGRGSGELDGAGTGGRWRGAGTGGRSGSAASRGRSGSAASRGRSGNADSRRRSGSADTGLRSATAHGLALAANGGWLGRVTGGSGRRTEAVLGRVG